MRKKLANYDKHASQQLVGPKFLIRGDSNSRLSIWNLGSLNQPSIFFKQTLIYINKKLFVVSFDISKDKNQIKIILTF